jgi:hypothetical protein
MQIAITIKGLRQISENDGCVMSEAHQWIHGETVEQLVSRLLYRATTKFSYAPDYKTKTERVEISPRPYDAWMDVIEIRLVNESGGSE